MSNAFKLTVLFLSAVSGIALADSDPRIPVPLRSRELLVMKAEMRSSLQNIQDILEAAARADWKHIQQVALAASKRKAIEVEPSLARSLPFEFRKRGQAVHNGFGLLAEDLGKGKPNAALVVKQLAGITQKCNACHDTYRFTDQPSGVFERVLWKLRERLEGSAP